MSPQKRVVWLSTLLGAIALTFCTLGGAALDSQRAFWVAPNGRPGAQGTKEDPWDLATALGHPSAVVPGSTIWLRGGTYRGAFTSELTGTLEEPIVVRQSPGERATIDGADSNGTAILLVQGAYTWFWGFEVFSSSTDRTTLTIGSAPSGAEIPRGEAIQIRQSPGSGVGARFINLVVHDARQGISFWKEATDAEIYGCLVYYNGWQAPDRGHGHGIYTQNQTGTKRIVDNIVLQQFGGGIHAYGSSNSFLDNFHIEGNTIAENGSLATTGANDNLLVGGGIVTRNDVLKANMLFYNATGYVPTAAFNFGFSAGCANGSVIDNYAANNTYFVNCSPNVMTGNTFYGEVAGFSKAQYPNNTFQATRPSGNRVFVRPNLYEEGRANVTVFNWDLAGAVLADLSGVLKVGADYEVRNAFDFYGPAVVSGTYAGQPVSIPMTGLTVASPVGWTAPAPLSPEFGAFIVLSASERLNPALAPSDRAAPRTVERPGPRR